MIYKIYQYLFKPEYLVLNLRGALHFDHQLNLINTYEHPGEWHQISANNPRRLNPLRIIIDAFDHEYCQIPLLSEHFWQRYQLRQRFNIDQSLTHKINFISYKNHMAHIVSVTPCNILEDWSNTINTSQQSLLSVESIAFGLNCIATTPQLYIIPTRFDQLRLIFVSGKGGIFCRFLNQTSSIPPIIEIQRTIHYICREFMIRSEDITVTASWQCPEIQPAMCNWQYVPVAPEYSERYLISLLTAYHGHRTAKFQRIFKIDQRKILWDKFFQPLAFAAALAMTIVNSISYHHNQNLQQKIEQTYADNQLRQQEYDAFDYQTQLQDYQQVQARNQPYNQACQIIRDPLALLYRLSLQLPSSIMTHLVYSKTIQPTLQARLLLEFTSKSYDHNSDHFDQDIQTYADFLRSTFKQATITVDHDRHLFDNSDDATVSLSPTSIIIQVDRIKL